jgi:hypothetical protein
MDDTEKKRFFWRSQNVILNGKEATCLTYDGLLAFFEATVRSNKLLSRREPGAVFCVKL